MLQIREALKILAERVLILETMIGIHGEYVKMWGMEGGNEMNNGRI